MLLPSRWTQMREHPVQMAYRRSPHRFNIVSAGRRSGKTELAKRKVVRAAVGGTTFPNARFFCAAPIRDQAKRIYWNDLKLLVPPDQVDDVRESDLIIRTALGSEIHVLGMDNPERIEGSPWDGGVLDEYANMKPEAWGANVRPALADRNGWCDLIGVPEGRNHYYDMDLRALQEMAERGPLAEFGSFTWKSSDILPAAEIEAARRDLPPKVFQQEYEGSFVDWSGVEFFTPDKWMDAEGLPLPYPDRVDTVFATVDTAIKAGKEHDGTGVLYCATSSILGVPVLLLDYDLIQIEGSLLDTWLPTVYQRLDELARLCGARFPSLGCFIEDKGSGIVLLQQAQRRNWPAQAIPSTFVALGKDERAISVSGYHHQGKVKISRPCYDKLVSYKGQTRNHLMSQVVGFRIGDKEAAKRADDLVDCYTAALAIALGNSDGY